VAAIKIEDRLEEIERSFSMRIQKLEEQVSGLSRQSDTQDTRSDSAWWKKIVGVNEDDPEFDEAMRLGREYRESLRPALRVEDWSV
jgi:hypothetical protein